MKRILVFCMTLVLLMSLCSCGSSSSEGTPTTAPVATTTTAPTTTIPTTTTTTEPPVPSVTIPVLEDDGTPVTATLNGVNLAEYAIVYDHAASDYTVRAALYVRDQIFYRTGAVLPMVDDAARPTDGGAEILVGETNRPLSATLNETLEGTEFSLLAADNDVAMEADHFVIAAAAYYFVETYITDRDVSAILPEVAQVCTPITEKPNNYIFLIGDGMGLNHTRLPECFNGAELVDYTDGENFFYGNLLPYQGFAHTNSLNNTTDSAASATALATGYKTKNGVVGRDGEGKDLKSLTELAGELGLSTAVMSTEVQTGATIAGFSAHVADRDETENILASQQVLQDAYGTIIDGDHDVYTDYTVYELTQRIRTHLNTLVQNEKGFFMMYEEAYIDKHSHEMDEEGAAKAVYRFNQAIATFMEFAFYHPDTFVLITADHETGALSPDGDSYTFGRSSHTGRDVPVYAYGKGAEVFHDKAVENVQIPKTISKMWGHPLATDTNEQYPPLN